MFESLDEKVRGKHCDGIAGIIEEGKSIMEEDFDETTMDACLIAAGQRAEHYEMAAYGTLVAWAQAMGHTEAAKLLQQTLDEEKAADKKLSGLAEGGINQSAADAAHPEEDEEPVGAASSGPGRVRRSPVAGSRRAVEGPGTVAGPTAHMERVPMSKQFAIVTGASSGIGLELAAICAQAARASRDGLLTAPRSRTDGDVVSGWKNSCSRPSRTSRPPVLAEQHRRMAEPGPAAKHHE